MMKTRVMRKLFGPFMAAVMVLGFILVPAGPVSAEGDVINVPADYTSIQAAVNAASAGDRIIVSAGNYQENVIIDKPLELFGTGQTGTSVPLTIITPSNDTQPVFTLNADGIRVRWFEINGAATGIYANGTSGHIIIENKLRSHTNGIVITGNPDNIDIGLSTFEYNTHALIIESGTGIIVTGNTFTNNTIHDIHLTETTPPFSYAVYDNAFVQGGKCTDDANAANTTGSAVTWYSKDTLTGNYWGDYTGTFTARLPNNIGDTPYNISDSSESAVNKDKYPLSYIPGSGVWIRIEAPDTALPGTVFTARLLVDNLANLQNIQYHVTYDPEILSYQGTSAGVLSGKSISSLANLVNPGQLNIVFWSATSAINGSGYLLEISFYVNGEAGAVSPINMEEGLLTASDGNSIPAIWTGHEIRIVPPPPGDANEDGTVNALDITKIARIILGYDTPTDSADANGDGKVNVSDIAKTARVILGIE